MAFNVKNRVLMVLVGLLAMVGVSAYAAPPSIEQAKNQCVIGEQADGYLGVVSGKSPSDAARRDMRDVNQQRKSYYADIARRNGVSTSVTAALAGEKLVNQARRGQCVRDQQGRWIQR